MFRRLLTVLFLSCLLASCGSDSDPVTPSVVQETDLASSWVGSWPAVVTRWENVGLLPESNSPVSVQFSLEMSLDGSYEMHAYAETSPRNYVFFGDEWGRWQIMDPEEGIVYFSPTTYSTEVSNGSEGSRLIMHRTGYAWICTYNKDASLLLEELPGNFYLEATNIELNLSRLTAE